MALSSMARNQKCKEVTPDYTMILPMFNIMFSIDKSSGYVQAKGVFWLVP